MPQTRTLATFLRPQKAASAMTKQKTKKAVRKRMKLTKTGKVKRRQAFTSHMMVRRSGKRKRHLREAMILGGAIGKQMAEALRTAGS